MIRKVGIIAAALSLALSGASAMAKVSEADANKLGNELTPLGAEKARGRTGIDGVPPRRGEQSH